MLGFIYSNAFINYRVIPGHPVIITSPAKSQ